MGPRCSRDPEMAGWICDFVSNMVCVAHYLQRFVCLITSGIPAGKALKYILVLDSKDALIPPI